MTKAAPPRDDATERQVEAAQPEASTWLSANAGSGKTRVLTDRVARLLLHGVEPQHILCLTYTKAAATEMQNRLFRRLGEWAMKPDAHLRADLQELGEDALLGADALAAARRLFARALETPGGLRIQTIHSFCATLLRRFPLEADVSPGFTELDDRSARLLREELVEQLSDSGAPELMSELARAYTGEDFSALLEQVAARRAAFAPPMDEAQCRTLFGVPQEETLGGLLAEVFLGAEADLFAALVPVLSKSGPTDSKTGEILQALLPMAAPGLAELLRLEGLLLTGPSAKVPFAAKIGSLPTKDIRTQNPAMVEPLENLMRRVESARPRRIALMAAQKTALLHRFAATFLPLYDAAKAARGWLDFDDLITRAKGLLTDPSVAAWVLFRLDGGIDHVLVDEAQDTSPDQWRVIELLTSEFTAGEGTRSGGRTLFVVGDKKQSIYSFQGADVAAFDDKHESFRRDFDAAGQRFQSLQLEFSFRSSAAILRLVDATFAGRFPKALGDQMLHIAFKANLPGRVDLWPLIEASPAQEEGNWEDPVDLVAETHHTARLARQIASEIAGMIAAGVQIPTDKGCRALHAGDVLILVQSRSTLFSEIIRACKQAGLPIAGADRLKLGAELAVKDLTALLSFLATPNDDLSLAALLRSPLCGWSEDDLFRLAHGRSGTLWEVLRERRDDTPTMALLHDLRDQSDYLRPYDLVERALTRHDGRRRLIARLGSEAEDGIDEFLSQALIYEQKDVPSLTGFLIWLETDEVEVKRQMDSEGGRIRVMTVHGAKGLEAPVVILPDTTDRKTRDRHEIYRLPSGAPVWKTAADESPPAIAESREDRRREAENESLRLLYVAMTRARCWLIVAGAGDAKLERGASAKPVPKEATEWAWYRQVEAGMDAVGAGPGLAGRRRFEVGHWPEPLGATTTNPVPAPAILPEWIERAAPTVPTPLPTLSPSGLGGAKALWSGLAEADEQAGVEAAKARGTILHALLEHLPTGVDPQILAGRLTPDASLAAELLAEAQAILSDPSLCTLFAPETLAEVAITAPLNGRVMLGSIDRLLVTNDRVLAVDFKSNAVVPAKAADVPEGILRQMGAYAVALGQIYPDRRIETAILWTANRQFMPLDPDIVSAALSRAPIA